MTRKHLTRAQIETIVTRNIAKYSITDANRAHVGLPDKHAVRAAMLGAITDYCLATYDDTQAIDPELEALMRSHVL